MQRKEQGVVLGAGHEQGTPKVRTRVHGFFDTALSFSTNQAPATAPAVYRMDWYALTTTKREQDGAFRPARAERTRATERGQLIISGWASILQCVRILPAFFGSNLRRFVAAGLKGVCYCCKELIGVLSHGSSAPLAGIPSSSMFSGEARWYSTGSCDNINKSELRASLLHTWGGTG